MPYQQTMPVAGYPQMMTGGQYPVDLPTGAATGPSMTPIPGTTMLAGGTVMPSGTVIAGGAVMPGGTMVPSGTMVPVGTTMPGGTMLPATDQAGVELMPAPETVESTNYVAGYLKTQIGRNVRVEFLVGTNAPLVDRIGTLVGVGASFILIRPTDTDDITLCDLYSIKFVTFYY